MDNDVAAGTGFRLKVRGSTGEDSREELLSGAIQSDGGSRNEDIAAVRRTQRHGFDVAFAVKFQGAGLDDDVSGRAIAAGTRSDLSDGALAATAQTNANCVDDNVAPMPRSTGSRLNPRAVFGDD